MQAQNSLSTRLEGLRNTSARVAEVLREAPQVGAVILFGSGAHGVISKQSDIDLLAVCDPDIPERTDREVLLSRIRLGWKIHAEGSRNALKLTSDNHKNMDGFKVRVGYQTAKWIGTVVTAVVEEGATTMSVCKDRPFSVLALIQRGWVLFDRENHIEKWREQSRTYPHTLKQNILREGIPSLQKQVLSLKALGDGKNAAEWSRQPRRVKVRALRDALEALTAVLYAINETYDPAQGKHMEETILPELNYVPDRFLERWRSVKGKEVPERFKNRWGMIHEEWYNSVSAFANLADDALDLARPHLDEKVGQ